MKENYGKQFKYVLECSECGLRQVRNTAPTYMEIGSTLTWTCLNQSCISPNATVTKLSPEKEKAFYKEAFATTDKIQESITKKD